MSEINSQRGPRTRQSGGRLATAPGRPPAGGPSKRLLWIALAVVAVALPVGAVILAHFNSSVAKQVQSVKSGALFGGDQSGTNAAKPPAGKPLVQQQAQAPPPVYVPKSRMATVPQSSQGLEIPPGPAIPQPNGAAPAPGAPAPIQPAVPGTTPGMAVTPVVYPARHDKVFGGGCAGQLSLSGAGLQFTCPENSHESLQFAMGDIASADDNGVRLRSGKKFHFSISGMSKGSQSQLFANWFSSAHTP